jgi:hypothetical protein
MVADEIIAVAIETDPHGAIQPLSKFAIKDQVTQALALDQVFQCLGHAGAKLSGGRKRILAAVLQDS